MGDTFRKINFVSGGLLFPPGDARIGGSSNSFTNSDNFISSSSLSSTNPKQPSWLDPVVNIDFNLVEASLASTERRFALAKFNDQNIFKLVRIYLSFLHDQDSNVCVDGHTKLSLEVFIRCSGLTTNYKELKGLFCEFVSRFNITEDDVDKDLMTMRKYISSDRFNRLHRNESSLKNFLGFH